MRSLLPTRLVAVALLAIASAFAAEQKSPPAKQPDNYPLKTCIVSGEALGSMGDSIAYVHKEAGKPDRVVRFCCEGCIDDFKADPAKFLKKYDDAVAAQKKAGNVPAKKAEPAGK